MPIRISPDRIWLYGSALVALNFIVAIGVWVQGYFSDWQAFLTAGSLAGSRALLDPFAWQRAHHLIPSPFVYTPGFAWFYLPVAHLTLREGTLLNGVAIVVLGVLFALLAEKLYGIARPLALLATFAWAPVGATLLEDQNAMFGLCLAVVAITGLVKKSPLLTGIAVGMLLYKPQYALPWILLLLFRKEWRALAILAGCAVVWWVLSYFAVGMDAHWFSDWIAVIQNYAATDFMHNADKTVSIPGLLQHVGIPEIIAAVIGFALLCFIACRLRNSAPLLAGSCITIAGLAFSPHAWDYDAVLALPAVFWALTRFAEPCRTRAVIIAYLLAPLWLFAHPLHFDPLAIVTVAGTFMLLQKA